MFLRHTWIQLWVSKIDIPQIWSPLLANPLPFLMEIVRPASLFFVTFWKIQGDGGVYTKFCSRILPFDHKFNSVRFERNKYTKYTRKYSCRLSKLSFILHITFPQYFKKYFFVTKIKYWKFFFFFYFIKDLFFTPIAIFKKPYFLSLLIL